jgi:cyclic-di-GMP-binding biofilm dispersal mediator protein
MSTTDFTGASILIAGGSGGLGSALATTLADRGARLALLGRDAGRLEAVAVPALRIRADIRRGEDCDRAVQRTLDEYGAIDGIVNAAGVVAFGPLAETSDEVLDALFATNVVGPLRLVRAALPHMQRGFLVNITAIVVERPIPKMVAYCASKGALAAATAALRREVRQRTREIDVIDVRPPHTETGLAGRPIAGEAPKLPRGLQPEQVASRIIAAIEAGETEVPGKAFLDSAGGRDAP